MPRFALVAHDHPFDHWDLFLEAGPVLRTWRLIPRLVPGITIPAEATPDHRLSYLDYEGPISGGRGHVSRVDSGDFTWEAEDADSLSIQVTGKVIVGRLVISTAQGKLSARFDPAR